MKIRYLFLLCLTALHARPKVLHLTFHRGCLNEFERIADFFDMELTSIMVQGKPPKWLDGKTIGNGIYNVTHDMAESAWQLHKDFFDQFDVIITSDTAPLARIFLQNSWKKPLIIWICNRFDYADLETARGRFPDQEYYSLFKQAALSRLVRIASYTPFEYMYAERKEVSLGTLTIKPCTLPVSQNIVSDLPQGMNKSETFFIPPYHNDTRYMNLTGKCKALGIQAYSGRYNGPQDLIGFKGIIHIPYGLSNMALFENIQLGLIYFVPSKKFIKELAQKPNFWFQNKDMGGIDGSEWYLQENAPLFVYFDSWDDLVHKVETLDYEEKRKIVLAFAKEHTTTMLSRWENIFKEFQLL